MGKGSEKNSHLLIYDVLHLVTRRGVNVNMCTRRGRRARVGRFASDAYRRDLLAVQSGGAHGVVTLVLPPLLQHHATAPTCAAEEQLA